MLTVHQAAGLSDYNARGELVCNNDGVLFSNNTLVSNETVCKVTAQWSIPDYFNCYTGIVTKSVEHNVCITYRCCMYYRDGNSAAYAAARCCWCTAPRSVATKICITSQRQRSAAYNNFFTFFYNYCW